MRRRYYRGYILNPSVRVNEDLERILRKIGEMYNVPVSNLRNYAIALGIQRILLELLEEKKLELKRPEVKAVIRQVEHLFETFLTKAKETSSR